ncbi:MAG: phosphodiester glycosidase family protein [Clostridia bacterium]|nr:phosphodiester glycosidase family protein [Clostridia bacterium]
MNEINTNEYLKRLEEKISRLNSTVNNTNESNNNLNENQSNMEDLGKTQILPRIQDLSEYNDNSKEVEKWKEKKYGPLKIENKPTIFDELKENDNKSSVLTEDKEELLEKEREQIERENQAFIEKINARSRNTNGIEENNYNRNEFEDEKPKKKWKKVLKVLFIIGFVLAWLGSIALFLFFKTGLFQYYKELYVQTAMTTMRHQYLAEWFLSDEEINQIMRDMEVVNNEDSILHQVEIPVATEEKPKENVINVDKITGDTYVGYVMTVSDPTKVKFVDSRKKGIGTKLSEICKNNNAIAGINAGGFTDPGGNGYGDQLCEPTIIDKKLLYGDTTSTNSWIALTEEGELVLGRYTYQEALDIGIVSGIQFGPYLIVNGNNQITKSNAGGLHPRMAIGQKKDGTIIFVCIDGRQPGYSVGTTLLELQNIFERYGAYNAANLDGGSSATMYYDGKIVNKTSTPIGERYLPNAIIVEQ